MRSLHRGYGDPPEGSEITGGFDDGAGCPLPPGRNVDHGVAGGAARAGRGAARLVAQAALPSVTVRSAFPDKSSLPPPRDHTNWAAGQRRGPGPPSPACQVVDT